MLSAKGIVNVSQCFIYKCIQSFKYLFEIFHGVLSPVWGTDDLAENKRDKASAVIGL